MCSVKHIAHSVWLCIYRACVAEMRRNGCVIGKRNYKPYMRLISSACALAAIQSKLSLNERFDAVVVHYQNGSCVINSFVREKLASVTYRNTHLILNLYPSTCSCN